MARAMPAPIRPTLVVPSENAPAMAMAAAPTVTRPETAAIRWASRLLPSSIAT